MTDVREVLGSALVDEPPTTVDPYAALAAGRRRRTRRHRWLAAGVTAAVVLGAVAAVGVPRLGATDPAPGVGPAGASSGEPADPSESFLGWVRTSATAESGFDLDVQRTLDNLDGAADRIQEQLGLVAVAPADPYDLDNDLGALQLAYRTADGTEVHVVVEGSLTASATASCVADPPVPELPSSWPEPTRGARARGSLICIPAPVVATTRAGDGRLDRTVAEDVEPLYSGAVSVTVTSDESAPPPVTVAAVTAVVEGLRPLVVLPDTSDSPPSDGPATLPLEQQLCMPNSRWAEVLEAYLTTVDQVRHRTGGPSGATSPAAKPWADLPGDAPAAWCVVHEGDSYRIVAATADGPTVDFVTSDQPLGTDANGPVVP